MIAEPSVPPTNASGANAFTKIAVNATDWEDQDTAEMHNAEYIRLRYPNAEFRWYDGLQRYTFDGMHLEMNFVREVRRLICEGLNIEDRG